MSDEYDSREEICADCKATADNMDARITGAGDDAETGRPFVTTTYHHSTCPTYTVNRILMEDTVRRAAERTEWMKREFPLVQQRLRAAAAGVEGPATPFVAALLELVDAQGEDLGRFVAPERWAEILSKHFPQEAGRGEEPTA